MGDSGELKCREIHGSTVLIVALAGSCLLWLNVRHGFPSLIPSVVLLFVLGLICETLRRLRSLAFSSVQRPSNQFGLNTALASVLLAGCLLHNIFALKIDKHDTSWRILAILLTFLAMMVNFAMGRWQRTRANAAQRTASALGIPPLSSPNESQHTSKSASTH